MTVALVLSAVLVASASQAAGFGPALTDGGARPAASADSRDKIRFHKPRIHRMLIPFGAKRRHEMADYSKRHYGKREWRLEHPKVIVEHYAVAGSVKSIFRTFAPDRPDVELGELPNVCSHFAVSSSGRIYQFVPLEKRCRHTVGLNDVAIGIEHVGFSDGDVMGNRRERRASLKLTRWLRCRFDIRIRNVIGHNESLSSRYHHELVPSLKNQTHGDMRPATMKKYRHLLRKSGRC